MNWSILSEYELTRYEAFLPIAGELSTDSLIACLKDVEGTTGQDVALFQAACKERLHGRYGELTLKRYQVTNGRTDGV